MSVSLKGQSNGIFDLKFFSYMEFTLVPDQRDKKFIFKRYPLQEEYIYCYRRHLSYWDTAILHITVLCIYRKKNKRLLHFLWVTTDTFSLFFIWEKDEFSLLLYVGFNLECQYGFQRLPPVPLQPVAGRRVPDLLLQIGLRIIRS